MSSYAKRREENERELMEMFGITAADLANEHFEYLNRIYQQYPGIPDPYVETWDRSDTELSQHIGWQKSLQNTATALRRAAEVCDQISLRSERTTRNDLMQNKKALLCAIHKAEDLVDELSMHYPLPEQSNYRIAKANPDLAPRTPTLLFNNADRILIWIPRIPSKKRGTHSMVFEELQELLWENRFAHMDKWHCDFVHVYHPDNLVGILDVDNYDYKPLIDALTLALATQDSYDHFSFGMFNFPHYSLKPGCYIHVCRREEKVGFFHDLVSTIQATQHD